MFNVDPVFGERLNNWYDEFVYRKYNERSITHSRANGVNHILMACPIWGVQGYMETFVNYSMATIVSPRNAAALAGRCTIMLFVPRSEYRVLLGSVHAFEKFGIEIIVEYIPDYIWEKINDDPMNKFWILGITHSLAMITAVRWKMGFSMYVPDHVHDHTFFEKLAALQHDHKAILHTGISANIEPAKTALNNYRDKDGAINIDAVQLHDIAMEFMHIQSKDYTMNDATVPDNMPHTQFQLWKMPDHLQIYSAFHNPIWMSYEKCSYVTSSSLSTLDTRMNEMKIGTEYYMPQASDEMGYIELSGPDKGSFAFRVDRETWIDRTWEQISYDPDKMHFRKRPAILPISEKWGDANMEQHRVDKAQYELDNILMHELYKSAWRRVKGKKIPPEYETWYIHRL